MDSVPGRLQSRVHSQTVMYPQPSAVYAPVAIRGVDRLPGWKVSRQVAPRAPLRQEVENRIQDIPYFH